jgi:hypothetical protein
MDPSLLEHWTANPKSLSQWSEALLAFKQCLKSLPVKSNDVVTTDMLSAKKRFQRQMKGARMPARNLFPDGNSGPKDEAFVEVAGFAIPSPIKPSLVSAPSSSKSSESERNFARVLRQVESGLETTTHNLIQNRAIIKEQDRILRGLESRLDTVQDQAGEIPLGLSSDFEAPTLNGQMAIIAEKVSSLKPTGVNILETQVVSWVNAWWSKGTEKVKIKAAESFLMERKSFLSSLVTSFQNQSKEVAALAAKVQGLTNGTTTKAATQTLGSSTFALLQQSLGLNGNHSETSKTQQIIRNRDSPNNSWDKVASAASRAAQATTIVELERGMKVLDA